jgi:hypothetical protein
MRTDRWPDPWHSRPPGAGLTSRMPPAAAFALALVTGTLWYATTRPFESLGGLARSPRAPLTFEDWAVLYSSIGGLLVVAAGLLATAIYLVERRRQALARRVVRRSYIWVDHRDTGTTLSIRRLHADIASCEARFRAARRSADPQEIARLVVTGRQTVDDILSELEAAGVRVHEVGAD